MGAYILRRMLLIIPTLIGIMIINFALVQFLPGGPVEQVIAQLEDSGNPLDRIGGDGGDAGVRMQTSGEDSKYQGARGLPPEFTFDFGESYFRSISVFDLVLEKMPVSISLGLWSTLIAYIIAIPLGIRKATHEGTRFDTWSSGVLIAAYSIPGFLFAIMLVVLFAGGSYWRIFPLRGLTSDNFSDLSLLGQIKDYFWHITLPILAGSIGAFTGLSMLTKNSFLDEIKKQYVVTARAKGLPERRVLYGHVFRNAMLSVIAGFSGIFISVFFGGSLFIETIFSLDGLGRLGFEATLTRDYPVMFGTLFFFTLLGLFIKLVSDLTYVWIDPRIDFESRQT